MTAKPSLRHVVRALPHNLADVALIDAPTCAAAGDMSLSWWHEEVRAGRAPAPVIRKPRCTRWRLSDVRAFWIDCATKTAAETEAAAIANDRAIKGSAQAKSTRDANDAAPGAGLQGQAHLTLAPAGCR
jgi:predicted DNA-binding transcriptional regulator AlpA